MDSLSDVREDLGYLPKVRGEYKNVFDLEKCINLDNQKQASYLRALAARKKNIEILKKLDPSLDLSEVKNAIIMVIRGRKIEFHLPSDTWYSYAKNEYGYGIESQVEKILKWLSTTS